MKTKKKFVRNRPIDIANKLLKKQSFWGTIFLIIPPILIALVLTTLFYFQGQWYPPIIDVDGNISDGSISYKLRKISEMLANTTRKKRTKTRA